MGSDCRLPLVPLTDAEKNAVREAWVAGFICEKSLYCHVAGFYSWVL